MIEPKRTKFLFHFLLHKFHCFLFVCFCCSGILNQNTFILLRDRLIFCFLIKSDSLFCSYTHQIKHEFAFTLLYCVLFHVLEISYNSQRFYYNWLHYYLYTLLDSDVYFQRDPNNNLLNIGFMVWFSNEQCILGILTLACGPNCQILLLTVVSYFQLGISGVCCWATFSPHLWL